jgi:hypothetical protein
MFTVLIQPRLRQRQPVGDVTPNDSRNKPNKTIGLAGASVISFGFLLIFCTAGERSAESHFRSQSFFSIFLQRSEAARPIPFNRGDSAE